MNHDILKKKNSFLPLSGGVVCGDGRGETIDTTLLTNTLGYINLTDLDIMSGWDPITDTPVFMRD